VLSAAPQGPNEIRLSEGPLRKRAVKVISPRFPEDPEKRGVAGVAVAEIQIDRAGKVSAVRVLQAPDPAIEKAVAEAVKEWRFEPAMVGGAAVRVRGKLTFYYVVDRGRGVVRSPDEMPRRD